METEEKRRRVYQFDDEGSFRVLEDGTKIRPRTLVGEMFQVVIPYDFEDEEEERLWKTAPAPLVAARLRRYYALPSTRN